tara:strand:+ start:402 stop:602 length:201 start_codon:yes stop_codon:yes gene_type:complete
LKSLQRERPRSPVSEPLAEKGSAPRADAPDKLGVARFYLPQDFAAPTKAEIDKGHWDNERLERKLG